MGYTTEFEGQVSVAPPLNAAEIAYLRKFNETRRMHRANGPYYLGAGFFGQDREDDIIDYNEPPSGQPGLWCRWTPTDDGSAIEWDGGEKFYYAEEWMRYIIVHFLCPGALASTTGDPQFGEFTFDHTVNGMIEAQGEDRDDLWRLVVADNVVSRIDAVISWPTDEPAIAWPDGAS